MNRTSLISFVYIFMFSFLNIIISIILSIWFGDFSKVLIPTFITMTILMLFWYFKYKKGQKHVAENIEDIKTNSKKIRLSYSEVEGCEIEVYLSNTEDNIYIITDDTIVVKSIINSKNFPDMCHICPNCNNRTYFAKVKYCRSCGYIENQSNS